MLGGASSNLTSCSARFWNSKRRYSNEQWQFGSNHFLNA
jgi:hypothetical protein